MSALQIHTRFDYPPIPLRVFDWSAVTDNYDMGDPVGRGSTEFLAIVDLLKQLDEQRVSCFDLIYYMDSPPTAASEGEPAPPEDFPLLAGSLPLSCRECKRTLIPGEVFANGFDDGPSLCHACKQKKMERESSGGWGWDRESTEGRYGQ